MMYHQPNIPSLKELPHMFHFWLIIFSLLFSCLSCNHQNETNTFNDTKLRPDNQDFFIKEIFMKYGNNASMSFEGFEHLLLSLGLGGLVIDDHNLSDHKPSNQHIFIHSHLNHNHSRKIHHDLHRIKRSPQKYFSSNSENHEHDLEEENFLIGRDSKKYDKCLSPSNLLRAFNLKSESNITISNFLYLCPAIIYELDGRHCTKESHSSAYIHSHNEDPLHEDVKKSDNVWLYGCLAVFVISICGLLSVAAIPLMHKSLYDQLLQLLVSLAIGTLTGDAVLHLIPHSLVAHDESGHDESEEKNNSVIWKGMIVLSGIYFFFILERVIIIITAFRQKNKANSEQMVTEKKNIGEKLSGHQKHDSYGYSQSDPNVTLQLLSVNSEPLPDESSTSAKKKELEANLNPIVETKFNAQVTSSCEKVTVIGHGHSHDHEVPTSLSAVAYMVIMGDGLHNFTDGLTIGAAFGASITGGLSTSIAVFCHELPHELGDFAVLLKSGMTNRQAIFYNFISSVCCLVGVLIGISLGNIESASNWIFAAAAGMFIYISLVDMVPQLHQGNNPKVSTVALQTLGIFFGIGLMLLIALFEEDIKKVMDKH